MKPSNVLLSVVAFTHGIDAVATPRADAVAIEVRAPEPVYPEHSEELWKRKGGGGGGGKGGSSGGGGSSGKGGGSGSGSGGGSSGRPTRGGSNDNSGGSTKTGSGPQPSYRGAGGTPYYPGGAMVPYRAGTSRGSIAPALLGGALLGLVAVSAFHYASGHGAYSYPYTNQYTFHNATTDKNETKPVVCLCEEDLPCGCEDNGDQEFFKSVIGDGSYENLNHSIVTVAKDDKTNKDTIYLNGALPNGTTASGGTDEVGSAAASIKALAQAAGWWPVATVAFSLAFLL